MEVAQSALVVHPSQSQAGVAQRFKYKNLLQNHTQRSALPLPTYQTINEGPQHAPRFRSAVFVDGSSFVSSRTFLNRKEAEQDAARVALEGISLKIKTEGVPLINNDTTFCKSILHEFAAKLKIKIPVYTTAESKGLFPLFITSVDFNGKTYKGCEGRNKREAEQLAARAAIGSILGSSDLGTVMAQIIKSKCRLYAALHKGIEGEGQSALTNAQLHATAHGNALFFLQHAVTHPELLSSVQCAPAHRVAPPPVQPAPAHRVAPPVVQPAPAHLVAPPVVQPAPAHLVAPPPLQPAVALVATLPVQPAVTHATAPPPVQPAATAEVKHVSTEAKMPKEEYVWESPRSIGKGTSKLDIPLADPPAGATDTVASVHGTSHVEQCSQVKNEVPLDVPSVALNEPNTLACNSGQKRSRKNKRGGQCKRMRTDDESPGTQGESSVNTNGV